MAATPTATGAVPAAAASAASAPEAKPTSVTPTPSAGAQALEAPGGAVKAATEKPAAVPESPAVAPASSTSLLSLADLPTDQVTRGLKEALGKGLQHAVASLGTTGGFLTNLDVKIPLPEKLQSVEKILRSLGQGAVADEFVTTMNRAAEQAVPAAAEVFAGGLQRMSVDDARKILSGGDTAATQFFQQTTGAELKQKFMPIVRQATAKSGATAAYKQLMDKARMASPFLSPPSLDLDSYVTDKATDGLFKMVAEEEKNIRQNPVARTTDVLKSVFGALRK